MRRSFKGAAAVAALCAGALTATSLAVATVNDPIKGSGSDATDLRIAGHDRIQTSLEALNEHSGKLNVMIVGYNGIVDALSLPPLVEQWGDSAIVYASPDGLDGRVLGALKAKASNIENIFISGGYNAVPLKVWFQLSELGFTEGQITRITGHDRFETAYLTAALAKNTQLAEPLRYLNKIERIKLGFASIKAAYEAAAKEAADAAAAYAAAAAEQAAASTAFADESAKVGDIDTQKHAADFTSVVKANAAAQKKYADLVAAKEPMARVLEAAKKWKPVAWKETTLGQVKEGVPSVAEDVDTIVNTVDAVKAATTKTGLAEGLLNDAIAAADAARTKSNKAASDASEDFMNATQNLKALGDPNSPVSKARARLKKADAAFEVAAVRLVKADQAVKEAEDDYRDAANLLLGGIEEGKAHAAVAAAAEAAFTSGTFNIFLATGLNYADALTAGPAAVHEDGVVLLTNGSQLTPQVAKALSYTRRDAYGVGGPAAKSFKKALPVVGQNRYETSAKVALKFFKATPGIYALASGETGADAVTAGVYMGSASKYAGSLDGDVWNARAVLLTTKASLPESVADFIQYGDHKENQKPVRSFVVFGGERAIQRGVVSEAKALSHN